VSGIASTTRRASGARERIQRAAARLFYRRGIHATGVELVAQEANVSKRTLYQHFPSKADLVDDYLRAFDARGGSPVEKRLNDPELLPRERLLTIFEAKPAKVFRGCPFHNAAVESAGVLPGVENIVRSHKLAFTDRLIAIAGEAGASEPEVLGRQLAVLFEGATAMATSLNDIAPYEHARAAAAALIDAST
jgi:AcrR family transcriptional regulator